MIGATIIVGLGLVLPITGYELVDIWITVFWLIGITNAINLLDNMDGLAAGIAAIAAGSLAIGFALNGQTNELLLMSIFIGALLGFLIFNFNPASIFMGDCGSMFVGFLLACSVLVGQAGGRSRGIFYDPRGAGPDLVRADIRYDVRHRNAENCGDERHHRAAAITPRTGSSHSDCRNDAAVLMIYAFAIVAGLLVAAGIRLGTIQSLALIGVFTRRSDDNRRLSVEGKGLRGAGRRSGRSRITRSLRFSSMSRHKRRIFEVFLDAFLITFSYYVGVRFAVSARSRTAATGISFSKRCRLLIVLKLFAFLAVGVYRGIWRYTSVGDLITFVKGSCCGFGLKRRRGPAALPISEFFACGLRPRWNDPAD